MEEGSSTSSCPNKPVIVRVKRKAFQSALDAFWLEIHERPLKKPLLDFGNLSISDASSSKNEELKIKKVLVQRVDTVISSEDTFDVVQSFVPNSSNALRSEEKNKEARSNIKTVNRRDQLLTKVKESHEVLSRNARFEQVWRSRKGIKETTADEALHDMCRLYDVVRVDAEEHEVKVQKRDTDLEDCRMMAQYLPLLKEVLPTAAEEIENDVSKQGYVYDVYAVNEDASPMELDFNFPFPLVQVDEDEDYYDGPDVDSEYESDDSNAENNPLNDYPDEEDSEDEDESTSKSSSALDSEDDESRTSSEESESGSESAVLYEDSELSDVLYEDEDEDEDQYYGEHDEEQW
ncbi:RNA-directed DNA methylation 4 [Andrographis paniculata]|uniref:RNA-directed DNA methylation 4 n=1 Tax=Andrographis paniculata TaxID=175694 RepID=UPI0021E751D5|nr:RNA-directed DNA methylation 4 [Andrographis paniculata]